MLFRPVRLTDTITATEFKAFMVDEVDAEANFTEGMSESKTLADYLADLETRVVRLQDPEDELWVAP